MNSSIYLMLQILMSVKKQAEWQKALIFMRVHIDLHTLQWCLFNSGVVRRELFLCTPRKNLENYAENHFQKRSYS